MGRTKLISFTPEEIAILEANPNVKRVRQNRLSLTLACRKQIYEQWLKAPSRSTIRQCLSDMGIGQYIIGTSYIAGLERAMQRSAPTNGDKGTEHKLAPKDSEERKRNDELLLASGKFVRGSNGNGITFSADFKNELKLRYPEQPIEDGLRAAGIDPSIVGYDRIYNLKRFFENKNNNQIKQEEAVYTEEEIKAMEKHPYVKSASQKKLVFKTCFNIEAGWLVQNGFDLPQVLEIFEINIEWLHTGSTKLLKRTLTHTDTSKSAEVNADWETLTNEGKEQYIRIQYHRMEAVRSIMESEWDTLKASFLQANPKGKRRFAEWLCNEVPHGKNEASITSLLKKLGISRNAYYRALKDDVRLANFEHLETREKDDIEAVRKVVRFKGYPKGSRQVYMQMEHLTGKHMSRKKIMRIMRENDLKSSVRKGKPGNEQVKKTLENVKPNLLKRRFRLYLPGEVFLTDVTYLKYSNRKLAYGSAILDSVTGRVIAFNVSESNDLGFVLETVKAMPENITSAGRSPIFHSDQGVLYLTDTFQNVVQQRGLNQSMSKRGNCFDNAPMESFWGHFKDECDWRSAKDIVDLQDRVQKYTQYFNHERGQWNRNRMTPVQFEEHINGMTEDEYNSWHQKELDKFQKMKESAKEKAIARAKNLGP